MKEFSIVGNSNGSFSLGDFPLNSPIPEFSVEQIEHYRRELNINTSQFSYFTLGSWLFKDEEFQLVCDSLKNASNLKSICFLSFAPSSETVARLVSAIQSNPNIKISLYNCGELLIQAMEQIQKDRPNFVTIMNEDFFLNNSRNAPTPEKPFSIEQFDFRIIYGFVAALGVSALICALVLLPATLLNPITATAVAMGTASLALGLCGLFAPEKSGDRKSDVERSTRLDSSMP
jgi:hypothetical protein